MITQSQVKVLKAISEFIKDKGISPTTREVCGLVGYNSSSTVHKYIETLEKLGCINKIESSPRSITITENGEKLLSILG